MLLNYHLLDVFTDTQMEGNPLAVVMKSDHLSDELMQKIAREFALSETAFLSDPKAGRNTAGVRIFTPQTELPFAGHPTIGTAVLLGLTLRASAIRLEEKIGDVTCVMDKISKRIGEAFFKLPLLPTQVGEAPSNAKIASSLGLDETQIGFGEYQPAVYSSGVEYVLVPVADQNALDQILLERRGWADIYGYDDVAVYAFTPDQSNSEIDLCARMFDLTLPGIEDPATGSAAAALIGLLAKHSPAGTGQKNYILEQGVAMGRPSLIQLQVGMSDGVLIHAGIGGKAVLVGSGTLDLDMATYSN